MSGCRSRARVDTSLSSTRKMMVVAEFRTEDMMHTVLKNVRKLAGSTISIEQDVNSERQHLKKVMLQLKRNILTSTKTHRVSVRNDKIKIDNYWFYWSKNKTLMNNNKCAKDTLKSLLGNHFDKINFEYSFIVSLLNSKN